MAEEIINQKIAHLKESFAVFDKNGDGAITAEELGKVLQSLKCDETQARIDQYMEKLDADRNGKIDFSEFAKVMAPDYEKVKKEFEFFDTDKDGFITKREVKWCFDKLGKQINDDEIASIFKQTDKNRDGKIDFKEFADMADFMHFKM